MKSALSNNKPSSGGSAIIGAAFLMATSAIGPGFLTQTTVFTQQLGASFGFVILISILLDIGAQLNIWRVITISGLRAQDLANKVLPGLGYLLAGLIVIGGLAFNIGNIAGCGLGLNVLSGMDIITGAIVSCLLSLFIFWLKEAGNILDNLSKLLGLLMIVLTMYIALSSHPPMMDALQQSFVPKQIDVKTIVTLVGGTVGGYISFSGAHRLLDTGIKGPEKIKEVNKSAISGIVVTGIMRAILFLAALGVVSSGALIDSSNPPAAVFKIAAGNIGYKFFGIVMWSAAITSVVGAAYTSASFLKTLHPFFDKHQQSIISFFIIFSTLVFVCIGKPVQLLLLAGAFNGLILPVALAVILVAANNKALLNNYVHPLWMQWAGWLVTIAMTALCVLTVYQWMKG